MVAHLDPASIQSRSGSRSMATLEVFSASMDEIATESHSSGHAKWLLATDLTSCLHAAGIA